MGMKTVAIILIICAITTFIIGYYLYIFMRRRALQDFSNLMHSPPAPSRPRRAPGLRRSEIKAHCPRAVFTHYSDVQHPSFISSRKEPQRYLDAVSKLPERLANILVSAYSLNSNNITLDPDDITPPAPVHPTPKAPEPMAVTMRNDTYTCVICLDEMLIGHVLCCLPCMHIFHSHCIRPWLRRRNACPCCSKPIKTRGATPSSPAVVSVVEAQPLRDREDPVSSLSHDANDRKGSFESASLSSASRCHSDNNDHLALQVTPPSSTHDHHLLHSVSGSSRDVDTRDIDSIVPCVSSSGHSSEQLGEQLPCAAVGATRASQSVNSVLTINPSVGYDIEAGHIVRV